MSRAYPRYRGTVRIGDYRVESHYLRFVADELRLHGERQRTLRGLEDSVIRCTPEHDLTGMPRGSGPSNPTHAAALRLMNVNDLTFKRRTHLRMWLATINDVHKHLPEEQQQVVRLLYWDKRYTILGVAYTLSLSRATVYRLRDRALLAFAVHIIGDHILTPITNDETK